MPLGSDAFQAVAATIEQMTPLTGPQARGAVRLALKEAGLEAALVGRNEMLVVIEKIMPKMLRAQGVDDVRSNAALSTAAETLRGLQDGGRAGPASVFDRLDKARKG